MVPCGIHFLVVEDGAAVSPVHYAKRAIFASFGKYCPRRQFFLLTANASAEKILPLPAIFALYGKKLSFSFFKTKTLIFCYSVKDFEERGHTPVTHTQCATQSFVMVHILMIFFILSHVHTLTLCNPICKDLFLCGFHSSCPSFAPSLLLIVILLTSKSHWNWKSKI